MTQIDADSIAIKGGRHDTARSYDYRGNDSVPETRLKGGRDARPNIATGEKRHAVSVGRGG